jgi:nitroreductase
MDLFDALARKRACRPFTKEPVSSEELRKLVYAAGRAPAASNRPYRHCILVDDPRVIQAIGQISEVEYTAFLDDLLGRFAKEVRRRSGLEREGA